MSKLSRRTLLQGSALAPALALSGRSGQDEIELPGKTKNTKFAVNVEMWFRDRPFLDRIRAAADLGFPAVEFWPWRNKDLDAIAALCEERGIVVTQFTAWGFTPGMNDPKNHDAVEEEIRASCEAAHRLGTKMMTVVAGNDQKGMTQAQMHDNVITALKRAAPIAEAADVMLILEPMNIRVDHKGHCLYGSVDAVRICREVDSPMVKINWDLYHCHISEGDLCGHLREGFDQLGYVQIADHPGRTEPGTGEIHYPRVLREVAALGYEGYVGVECRPSKPEAEAAKALWYADQW